MLLLSLILPLILLAGLGWLLTRFQLIKPGWLQGTTELSLKVLIPSLLLLGMYEQGLPQALSWRLLLAYFLPFGASFLVLAWVVRKTAIKAQFSLAAVYGNTVFIGIPLVVQLLGEASLRFTFPIVAFHSLVGFSLYYLVDAFQASRSKFFASLLKTLRNPIVLSLLLGLLLNELAVPLPEVVLITLSLLAEAALPTALLVLGASLAQFKLAPQRLTLAITSFKLLLLPLGVLLSALYLFRLSSEIVTVLVILAGCPVGVNAYILAVDDNKGVAIVSSAILSSSLLAMLTLPLWLAILTRLLS